MRKPSRMIKVELTILELLNLSDHPMTVKELSHLTGESTATIAKVLKTMHEISVSGTDGKWWLSPQPLIKSAVLVG